MSPKFGGFRQDRQDRQTDRQTDAISMFWAFLNDYYSTRVGLGGIFPPDTLVMLLLILGKNPSYDGVFKTPDVPEIFPLNTSYFGS